MKSGGRVTVSFVGIIHPQITNWATRKSICKVYLGCPAVSLFADAPLLNEEGVPILLYGASGNFQAGCRFCGPLAVRVLQWLVPLADSFEGPFGSPSPLNSGIVAWPEEAIPVRLNTEDRVFNRISASSFRLQLSTYHVSRENFWSQVSALRPLIWDHPVMPGKTS